MKRVLFLIPTLDKGGAENVLLNLVNHMDYSKFDITVQTLFDQDSQKSLLNPQITYKTYRKKQFRGNSKLFARLPATLLYRLIVKEEYDIVVSYLEGPTAHIISGCPYPDTNKVAWIHTAFDKERGFLAGFRSKNAALKGYCAFDLIACVAEKVKERFIYYSGLDESRCKVLYNTINSNEIKKKSKIVLPNHIFSNEEINIVSTGKIQPVKGYDRLAIVQKKLKASGLNTHIYILGVGNQRAGIERFLIDNNILDSFTFLGFSDNPYNYLAAADMFVCSSRREGFSTAVTEALILGKPVVSTNCSGSYELMGENNEYGIVTENNEDALYEGIKKMVTMPGLLEHYAKKAKERGEMFSIAKTVGAVEEMLMSI